ncbi:MAG: hypothetical protein JNK77_14285 [Saprospiraceae bacterium]|nr:hypothetical protein [Saprospiraceae bacterium]
MKMFLTFVCTAIIAANVASAQTTDMPKVFVMGENEKGYEQLTQTYGQSLLEAAGNDFEKAFGTWLEMMVEMDNYSKKINFDIKGVKIWMHVFWGEDGKVNHIGYLLRPDSRNINTLELNAFFSSFIGRYKFPITSEKKFSHYTAANFPTLGERAGQ